MADADRIEIRTLDKPDEVTHLDDGSGTLEAVRLYGLTVSKITLHPGWSWERSVKPMVGTEWCQFGHNQIVLQGRMQIRMNDGTEIEVGPGNVVRIPPGHDASVVGNQTFVAYDFSEDATSIADAFV